MLTGVSFLAVICKIMVNQVEGVFGYHKNVFIAKTVSEAGKEEGRKDETNSNVLVYCELFAGVDKGS